MWPFDGPIIPDPVAIANEIMGGMGVFILGLFCLLLSLLILTGKIPMPTIPKFLVGFAAMGAGALILLGVVL